MDAVYTLFWDVTPCNRAWRLIDLSDLRLPHFLENPLTVIGEVVSVSQENSVRG
jgi:hypothetical protein